MKDMTPQEKLAALAAELRADARLDNGYLLHDAATGRQLEGWADRLDAIASEHGEVVVTTDASGRCVAVTRQDGEGRILSVIWEASEHGGGGEAAIPLAEKWLSDRDMEATQEWRDGWNTCAQYFGGKYTTPPTPSAPAVYACPKCGTGMEVDPAAKPSAPVVDRDRIGQAVSDYLCGLSDRGSLTLDPFDARTIDAIVDVALSALSGVSAPVGVAGWYPIATVPRDGTQVIVQMKDGSFSTARYNPHSEPQAAYWTIMEWPLDLTPPAAAPRVEMINAPQIVPAASEDGLPEEIEAIVCPLEDDAAAMLERLPDDGTAHTMQAAAALIRRLAASGQGVRLGHRISLIQKGVRWNTLCDLIDSGDQNLYTILTDAMNMGAGALEMYVDEKIAALAGKDGAK